MELNRTGKLSLVILIYVFKKTHTNFHIVYEINDLRISIPNG